MTGKPSPLRLWLTVAAWMITIFILSSLPGSELPKTRIPHADKMVHFVLYFILGGLIIRAFIGTYPGLRLRRLVLLSVALVAFYAASDEFHQYFVPARSMDIVDFLVDIFGASFAFILGRK